MAELGHAKITLSEAEAVVKLVGAKLARCDDVLPPFMSSGLGLIINTGLQ
jgi:hypothetical protein